MATSLTAPRAISQPWANSGDKATVPDTTSDAGVASLAAGIPAECSLPIGSGGAYVRRRDVNALGNMTTDAMFFAQNGGSYTFDQDVSDAIGGYPQGAKLWATVDGHSVLLRSLINNNTYNFVTTPAYINDGVNWVYDLPIWGNYLHVRNEQTSGTDGGTFTSGSWATRVLNTTKTNEIAGASLGSNQITLPAGTYRIIAQSTAWGARHNKLRLRNITDSADTIIGTNAYCQNDDDGNIAILSGEFTITGTKVFEIQHRCSQTKSDYGLGRAAGFGVVEVYSDVEIWKVV